MRGRMDDNPSNAHVTSLCLAVCCSKPIKPTNHLALCLLLNSYTMEYLVLHEIFLRVWAACYFLPHHIVILSAVS